MAEFKNDAATDVATDDEAVTEPWTELEEILARGDRDGLLVYLENSSTGEKARAVSRLGADDQRQLFALLPAEHAADLVDEIPDPQAVQLLGELPTTEIAAIVDHLPSDEQADLINRFDAEQAEAILEEMHPLESADARQLRAYPEDCAGGLMVTEFLTCLETSTIGEVIDNLRGKIDDYTDYDVQYLYVVSADEKLVGVLPMRDLVLSRLNHRISDLMIGDPLHLAATTSLDDLADFFQRHAFIGVPVTDESGKLVGVVRRADVDEARAERADETLRRFSGLIGGEELRSMPLYSRSLRRMIWLTLTIMLNLVSASVIGFFQTTLNEVIALAVFLPVISGVGGSSGNQAIAVSMRELSLGLIKPYEIKWVVLKEVGLGAINGLILGAIVGLVAWSWKGNFYLGAVVATAMMLSNTMSVCLGGGLPLVLKRFGIDPALAAGPILMTLADFTGFFLALSFATLLLEQLRV